jgi:hypothetical protein
MTSHKNFPWYALLIAIYGPLALLAENSDEVGLFAANRTVLVMVLGELLLLFLLSRIYRDWHKAGVVAALLTVMALAYGHIYSLLEKTTILGVIIGRHRYLLIIWTFFVVLVFYLASKAEQSLAFEKMLKPVSLFLLIFVVIRLGGHFLELKTENLLNRTGQTYRVSQTNAPDVYYIILDAYGGQEVLSNDFDVDTTEFLDTLRSMGFVVPGCSQSNYAHTHLSLASSLNFDYLDNLGDDFVPGNKGWAGLANLIRNSKVRFFFEERGYQSVAFETGYAWTEWSDADLFIKSGESFFSRNLTSFEALFLHTTIGVVAVDFKWIPEPQQNMQHYDLILSNLKELKDLSRVNGPKFVFTHLVIPHHPFVFDANGEYRRDPSLSPAFENYTDEEYYNGYRQQVMFIDAQILEVVESILSNSEHKPIIIIQGDHGPSHAGEEARMSILNAYYFPDDYVRQLSAGITPVNTFRIILNTYFDQDLPLLQDISYFSKNADPYSYTVIPNECTP